MKKCMNSTKCCVLEKLRTLYSRCDYLKLSRDFISFSPIIYPSDVTSENVPAFSIVIPAHNSKHFPKSQQVHLSLFHQD